MMNQAQPRIPDNGHDEEMDPEELTPSTSGNAPIITVPAPRDEGPREEMENMHDFLGEIVEQIQMFNSTMQEGVNLGRPPVVPDDKLWDTESAWDRELDFYPDASRSAIISRLYNQIWDLLQKMKERVTRQTWSRDDQGIVEGLINIMILSVRNNIISNKMIEEQARRP